MRRRLWGKNHTKKDRVVGIDEDQRGLYHATSGGFSLTYKRASLNVKAPLLLANFQTG